MSDGFEDKVKATVSALRAVKAGRATVVNSTNISLSMSLGLLILNIGSSGLVDPSEFLLKPMRLHLIVLIEEITVLAQWITASTATSLSRASGNMGISEKRTATLSAHILALKKSSSSKGALANQAGIVLTGNHY